MKKRHLWLIVSSLVLAGCSHSVPPAETLDTTIGQLNRSLSHLSEQSAALAYQHRMNAASVQGAWIMPEANSPVELLDPHAKLLLQLRPQTSDGGPLLQVKNVETTALPAFELTVAQTLITTAQQEATAPPEPEVQQVFRQTSTLSPGEEARFVLQHLAQPRDQSLLVNVHQFRSLK